MNRRARPVMILAGGTGGHVFPALAVAEALQTRGVPVVWMGSPAGLEARLVPAAGIPLEGLQIKALRGKGLLALVLLPGRLLRAVWQAWRILRRWRPRAVLGMGGYVAGPGGLAAWLCRVPLVIHEQNAIPGLTNRYLARLAQRKLEAFPQAFPDGGVHTGNPVRPAITAVAPPAERFAGRKGPLRLLVIGGSQGAGALNRLLPEALARLDESLRPEVWHQAGERHLMVAEQAYAAAGMRARLAPFIEDMPAAYAWADLVLCRAGAMTVAELAAVGLGAILVPFPYAVDDHQTHNAEFLVQAGAAVMLPEAGLDALKLAAELRSFALDRPRLLSMAEAARRLAQPLATERVADICLEVAA